MNGGGVVHPRELKALSVLSGARMDLAQIKRDVHAAISIRDRTLKVHKLVTKSLAGAKAARPSPRMMTALSRQLLARQAA